MGDDFPLKSNPDGGILIGNGALPVKGPSVCLRRFSAFQIIQRKRGAFRGMRARGGFEVDVEWQDGTLTRVVLRATVAGEVAIEGPGLPRQTVRLAAGESRTLVGAPDR